MIVTAASIIILLSSIFVLFSIVTLRIITKVPYNDELKNIYYRRGRTVLANHQEDESHRGDR